MGSKGEEFSPWHPGHFESEPRTGEKTKAENGLGGCVEAVVGTVEYGSLQPARRVAIVDVQDCPEHLVEEPNETRVKPRDIMAILEAQGYRCAYTGDELTPENTSADHRVPFSRGGSHGPENISLVLGVVNAAKGGMTLQEFVEMCRKVVATFGTTGEAIVRRHG